MYLTQTAASKMDDIWEEIEATSTARGKFPSGVGLGGIFLESMNPSFD